MYQYDPKIADYSDFQNFIEACQSTPLTDEEIRDIAEDGEKRYE